MIIDTHSHIYDSAFDVDRSEVIARAKSLGIEHIVLANVDLETIAPMKRLYGIDPTYFSMAMGLHPTSVVSDNSAALFRMQQELDEGGYCAIGEVGMDLYWDTQYESEQASVFKQQIEWAIDYRLPLIIHTRKAFAELFAVMKPYQHSGLRGVFHCFGGGIEEAKKALSMGFHLGIGGVVTYKNSNLGELLQEVGVERLLIETDAPYLPPVPYRGKRNEPSYLLEISAHLGKIFGISASEVCRITTENAKSLFNIV